MEADHRLTEQRRVIGMLREVVEERYPVRLLKAGFSGLHGVDHLFQAMRAQNWELNTLDLAEPGAPVFSALTDLGKALKTGAPGSARSSVLISGSPWAHRGWDNMIFSVQTGETGFEKAHGVSFFDYLAQHPDDASLFSETMVGFHSQEPSAVAAAYDFSTFKTVVDVGGATGNMLATVLASHSGPRGILFDRPHVVQDAPALLDARGVSNRVTIEPGSFFESVPTGADAYILSHILHDWNEDQCLTILEQVRKAVNPAGRLLIVEMVILPGDAPHPGKMLDMAMLVQMGGQERTADEYELLLSKARFRLAQVVPTNSAASILEAVTA